MTVMAADSARWPGTAFCELSVFIKVDSLHDVYKAESFRKPSVHLSVRIMLPW